MRQLSMQVFAALLCAGFAMTPALACSEAGRDLVARNPDNTDARYELARSCAQAGHYEEALTQYDDLLTRDPENSDWLLGKAQSLIALNRPREALPYLEHGRKIAPAYEDIWRANATALELLHENERADALLADAARAFPQATWPAAQRTALANDQLLLGGTRVTLAASYEDLSGDRDPWRAINFNMDKPLDDRRRLLAGLNAEERFDERDGQLIAGYVDRLSDDWSFSVSGDIAPDAEVLPEWSLAGEVARRLPGERSIALRARHASYSTTDVDSLAATIEQYAAQFRIAYTLTAARPTGLDTSFGHSLRIAHDYGDASHVTLSLGFGEEAETVALGVVQVTQVRSISVNGVHRRSPRWGFSWEIGWYEQGDLYDRLRIGLGLEHRL